MNKEEQVKIENLMINLNNLTEENLNRFYWVIKGITIAQTK